jgi:succinate-acetate transporter protein
VKINRANGQIGRKYRGSTFVLTVLISFGLFNIFQINLLLDDSGDYDSSSLMEKEA